MQKETPGEASDDRHGPEPLDQADASLTTTEAARRLRLSVSTIRLMVEQGHLRAWRTPGGHRRVSASSVENWLSARVSGGSTSPEGMQAAKGEPSGGLGPRLLFAAPQGELADYRDLLTAAFPHGVAWVLASNALQALMLVERERPDLLILSSRLEPVDGFALVEHLRRHATFRQVPAVVLLSDDELEGQQVRAHRPPGAMVWRALFPLARIQGLIDGQRAAAWREQR